MNKNATIFLESNTGNGYKVTDKEFAFSGEQVVELLTAFVIEQKSECKLC